MNQVFSFKKNVNGFNRVDSFMMISFIHKGLVFIKDFVIV